MRRSFPAWLAFLLFLAVGFSAMAWISWTVLRLDRAQAEAARQAQFEENIRLALWRMDSALAPLIAQENARPYFAYTAFVPAERAYGRMYNKVSDDNALTPSPLLAAPPPQILLYFQINPDGLLTSPQVPPADLLKQAEGRLTTAENIQVATTRLVDLRKVLRRDALLAALPAPQHDWPAADVVAQANRFTAANALNNYRNTPQQQIERGQLEFQARQTQQQLSANTALNIDRQFRPSASISEAVMQPLWVDSTLILARRISIAGQEYIQGCWLDWPATKQWLLESVSDLLPAADLVAAQSDSPAHQPRMLAGLPARLVPGPLPLDPNQPASPVPMVLAIAWAGVLLTSLAVGLLLRGLVLLSERRGAFVSAVTHELRTPLTTLRMYAEMLAEGMINDEPKRHRYLLTLRAEADRLGHLVENVLAYSRLERTSPAARMEELTLSELLDRVQGRLADRARQAQMSLAVEAPPDVLATRLRTNPLAIEQILFNLVDNACKYARSATDTTIHLGVNRDGGTVHLCIRDHGPGLSAPDRQRLFRPFSKSVHEAAATAPGLGLGLALSRRLARALGGDLRLEPANSGASFVLTLPAA